MIRQALTLIPLLLILTINSGKSQNIDSLLTIADNTPSDSVKLTILLKVASNLSATKPDSAIHFYRKSLEIAQSKGLEAFTFRALTDLGMLYLNTSQYSEAKMALLNSLEGAKRMNDSTRIMAAHSNLGSLYAQIGAGDKTILHLREATNFITHETPPNEIGKLYGRLGNFYLYNQNYPESEEYFHKAIPCFERAGNKKGMIVATQNLGVIEKRRKNYNKGILYYEQALKSYREINYVAGIGQCLANIGEIYYLLGLNNLALHNQQEALRIFRENNMLVDEILVLCSITNTYNSQKQYNKSINALQDALNQLDKCPENKGLALTVYYQLQNTYKQLGDIDRAYLYLSKYQLLSDSIARSETQEKVEQLRTQFEVEQKEKDLKLLTTENELKEAIIRRKNIFQIFYIVSIGLAVATIVSLYFMFRTKKRSNRELLIKNAEILQQKEEITAQRDEIEAQKEEIEAQRDDLEVQRRIAIDQRDEIARQKKNITDSIAYARHIQTALFPNDQEVKQAIPECFVYFKPLDIVSGDFYWVHKHEAGSILAVADCTGHGVPGAIMSVMGINFLNSIVHENNVTDPGLILTLLNDQVITALSHADEHLQDKDGMDISLCSIDFKNRTMLYSCAKNRILVVRAREVIQLEAEKYSIGKSPFKDKIAYTTQQLQLQPNDMVYLMTDGYIDQFGGPFRSKFLASRFKKLIAEISSWQMSEQKNMLERNLNEWQGPVPQIDDILVVGMRIS
jgi:serine phosphatase RsbU (regulator of sigma subunit)